MTTRPTDPRDAARRGSTQFGVTAYYDEDDGWCAEITDGDGDFIGIAIATNERDALRKAQDMIKEASRE